MAETKKRGGDRRHPKDCVCGACPKVGRKKKEQPPDVPDVADKGMAAEVLALPEVTDTSKLRPDITAWHELIWERDTAKRLTTKAADNRRYLTDKRDGKAVHHVNHMHDKPMEVSVTHTLSERMMIALQKAEARVRTR